MSNKEKTIIIVSSVFVGGLLLIGLAVAMFNAGANLQTTTTVKSDTPVKAEPKKDTQITLKSDDYGDYVAGAEGIYMDSCDDGTNTSYCKCTYDWLNDNLTNKEFLDLTIEAQNGKTPDLMYDAVKACT